MDSTGRCRLFLFGPMELIIPAQPAESSDLSRSRRKLYHPLPERLSRSVTRLRGVDYSDGQLVFDGRLYAEADADLVVRHAKGERLAVRFQGQGRKAEVTDDDLAEINANHSSVALKKEDLVVFERYSANDAPMRSPLKFTRRALEKFAQDFAQGRGVHLNHEDNRGFGRTFAAKVEEATLRGITANWLVIRSFAVTKDATPDRLQLIADVQTGVLGYDSITFMAGQWTFQEIDGGENGPSMYFFEIDDDPAEHPRLEAIEVSVLSTLGNVYGAGDNVRKNSLPSDSEPDSQPETIEEYYYG